MINTKAIFLNIFLITMLSACAATGAKFQPLNLSNPDNSLIYIYRPSAFVGGGSYPDIFLDNKNIGSLKNGGYLVKEVAPGKHVLTSKGNAWNYALPEKNLKFEAMPGESQYVRYLIGASVSSVVGTMAYMNADNAFHFVKPKYAREEIKQLNLSK